METELEFVALSDKALGEVLFLKPVGQVDERGVLNSRKPVYNAVLVELEQGQEMLFLPLAHSIMPKFRTRIKIIKPTVKLKAVVNDINSRKSASANLRLFGQKIEIVGGY